MSDPKDMYFSENRRTFEAFVSFHFVFLQLITWLTASCDFVSASVHRTARKFFLSDICRYIVKNKVTPWSASYSTCVVYTKTIIHLSVGESGGYLPPFRWIIVNYITRGTCRRSFLLRDGIDIEDSAREARETCSPARLSGFSHAILNIYSIPQ